MRVENIGADPLELGFIMSFQYGDGIWVPGRVVAEAHQGALLAPGDALVIADALDGLAPATVHQLHVVATPTGSDPDPSSVSATVYAGGSP